MISVPDLIRLTEMQRAGCSDEEIAREGPTYALALAEQAESRKGRPWRSVRHVSGGPAKASQSQWQTEPIGLEDRFGDVRRVEWEPDRFVNGYETLLHERRQRKDGTGKFRDKSSPRMRARAERALAEGA